MKKHNNKDNKFIDNMKENFQLCINNIENGTADLFIQGHEKEINNLLKKLINVSDSFIKVNEEEIIFYVKTTLANTSTTAKDIVSKIIHAYTAKNYNIIVKLEMDLINEETAKKAKAEENKQKNLPANSLFKESQFNDTPLSRHNSFSNFIKSVTNKEAYNICKSISKHICSLEEEELSVKFRCIYGESGVGKTHLIQAMIQDIRKKTQGTKICRYITQQNIHETYVKLAKQSKLSNDTNLILEFKNWIIDADIIFIDDIHLIIQAAEGKQIKQSKQLRFMIEVIGEIMTQEKLLVVVSNQKITEIEGLKGDIADHLMSRMNQLVNTCITPANYELKYEYTKQMISKLNLHIQENAITYIAENITEGCRNIDALCREIADAIAMKSIENNDTNKIDVKCLKSDRYRNRFLKNPDETIIINTILKMFSIKVEDLHSKSRKKEISNARHLAMFFLFNYVDAYNTVSKVAKYFNRDSSTVSHAIKKVKDDNAEFSTLVTKIKAELKNN